jgi:Holliday junction resolvase-like predicted endonuclease
MVNPRGVLRSFKITYPEVIKINLETVAAEFLGQDGRDFVGNAVFEPSGAVDLHIKVSGSPKPISVARVKMGEKIWNNRSYGINPPLKVVQSGQTTDLYFEPPSDWKEKNFEVYLIYEDGGLARTELWTNSN